MPQSDVGERSWHLCIVCDSDLRHDPIGPCPECGATLVDRQRILARQGEINQRQSQSILVGLGCMVLGAIALSVLVGAMQIILGI
jgi:hypothetical protein